jgi:hypothetical protein
MDEAAWLACNDPRLMLQFLRGKVSDRKLRLFACAYCRVVRGLWHLGAGAAVAVAERYADGLAGAEDLASERRGVPFPDEYSEWVLAPSAYEGAWQPVGWLTGDLHLTKIDPDALRHHPLPLDDLVGRSVHFLQDIFGNPFRPVALDPAWRTPAVLALSQAAYDHRTLPAGTLDPERLTVLADTLEEVGCDNADILGHLRGPGPHTRGCFAVDAILAKK